MSASNYDTNGVLRQFWDDATNGGQYTEWDENSVVTRGPVLYSALAPTDPAWPLAQGAAARLAASTADTNLATLRQRAQNALTSNAAYLALASPTNAQVAAQVGKLTRQMNAVIRMDLKIADTITDS